MTQQELWITSTLDGTQQPSLFYKAKGEKRPLLVGLHTWSFDRFNQVDNLVPIAQEYDFNLLLPEFRGKNLITSPNCTEACGSVPARQDIKDAIDYVVATYGADAENVFLFGCSGGGHMALMMAGYCPEYFRSIAAFVPISDLEKWTRQNKGYAHHVEACCGSTAEMFRRSPISCMENIAKSNTKIFHGKYDKVVPVEQSISFYNRMIAEYPDAKVYLDIFDGGHENDFTLFRHWMLTQYEKYNKSEVTG